MHYNVTATFREGPTILDEDAKVVTLRRYCSSDSQRDKVVQAMNTLGPLSLNVETLAD
jgi:hypothetical protein